MNAHCSSRSTGFQPNAVLSSRNNAPKRILPSSRFAAHQFANLSTMRSSRLYIPSRQRSNLQVLAAVKKTTSKNVACSKTLVTLPGKESQVADHCKTIVDYTKQRMSDRSSGILSFDCSQDAGEPNVFHFWELYESNAALGRHNTSPEFEKFMKDIKPLLEGPVGMALYEMKDGKLGAVAVQGGPRGEGGLDDATGASGAAGGASYKQTSAVVDLTAVKEEDDEARGLWGIKFELPWMKKKDK